MECWKNDCRGRTRRRYYPRIGIEDENERKFYEKEAVNSKWSTRELGRQIESGLYQRLLLSDGKANKEKVLQLAKEGQTIEKPKDIIKEPYVFEFLGIKEEKPLLEKDLEYKLIRQLEDFLLELRKRVYVCRFTTKNNNR